LLTKLAVGGAAGVFGTSIIYPIDVVKTKLQAGKGGSTRRVNAQQSSISQVIKNTYKQDGGFRGFYRGLSANLVGIIAEKGIKLGFETKKESEISHFLFSIFQS